jgi:hypothetical protein
MDLFLFAWEFILMLWSLTCHLTFRPFSSDKEAHNIRTTADGTVPSQSNVNLKIFCKFLELRAGVSQDLTSEAAPTALPCLASPTFADKTSNDFNSKTRGAAEQVPVSPSRSLSD